MTGVAGKAILVTGGGSGIGAATALRLSSGGARVAVADINRDNASAVVASISATGGVALAIEYDQADESSIVGCVATAAEALGQLDGLLANAADMSPATIAGDKHVLKMNSDTWERAWRVNMLGTALLVRETLPHLLVESRGGSIVLTSSSASSAGDHFSPAYATTKAGINALARHVATKYGRQKVRCNAVAPGLVLSDGARAVIADEIIEMHRNATRSYRLGELTDISAVMEFLLSDESGWVNGQVGGVDGGQVLRQ